MIKCVNGLETYQLYSALKLHFTTDFDAVKYNFKTTTKRETFEKRKDRYFFEKLSRKLPKEKMIDYFTANLLQNPKVWIGDMCDKAYSDYQSRYDKLSYMFSQDLNYMSNKGYSFDQLCKPFDDNSGNPLLSSLQSTEIHMETVVLIDIMVNFLKKLKGKINDPLGINKEQIDRLLSYKSIMLTRPLPLENLKKKVLLAFTS